jgi:hypothetical protein
MSDTTTPTTSVDTTVQLQPLPAVSDLVSKTVPPNDLQVTTDQVNQVVDSIKEIVAGRSINAGMIFRIVANCIQVVGTLKVNNTVAKKIVTNALQKYIEEQSNLNDDDVAPLMMVVNAVVGDAFDVLTEIQKGELALEKKMGCSCLIC